MGKNRKLEETFTGPYVITKVNDNGIIKMRAKYSKPDQLVKQNQFVKYKKSAIELKIETEKESVLHPVKKNHTSKNLGGLRV